MICKTKMKFNLGLMFLICFVAVANKSIAQMADKTETDNTAVYGPNEPDTLGSGAVGIMPVPEVSKLTAIIYDNAYTDGEIDYSALKIASKKYSKTYTAGKLDELMIDNRFGEVKINTWSRNEFSVEVQVKIYADKQADAQNFLELINVIDSRKEASVSFKTTIGDNGGNSNVLWKGEDKPHLKKIEINYVVFMPSKNALNVSNSYGAVILPDFEGKLMLNSLYSNLEAKRLINPLNNVKLNFGNANIESFSGTKLEILHGGLNLNEGNNFNASVTYGPTRIGKVYSTANISVKFGKQLRIDNIDKHIKTLNVNAAYTSVQFGKIAGLNADFDMSACYGRLNSRDPHIKLVTNPMADTPVKNYKGRLGKGSASRNIMVKTNFSQVDFD